MVISPLEHPNTATGDPWMNQPRYANAIAGVGGGLIALWTIQHHVLQPMLAKPERLTALARWLSNASVGFSTRRRPPSSLPASQGRQTSGRTGRLLLPSTISLGVLLLMSVFFLLPFTIATFTIMPYYRTLSVYGSPPLAIRAGFMALGTMPFLYATSSKVSYLNALTGVKSETWLIWHTWGARFCLFLATVHTVPFIYQPLREGRQLQLSEVFKSDDIYSTGILAYVALAVLVLPSGKQIRHRCYSLWLALHIPVALIFLVAMWIHCENLLTSWRFMYAATFFYLLNIALRLGKMLQNSDFFMHTTAQLSVYPSPSISDSATDHPSSLTRLVIPTSARWAPGQHVFIRLLPSLPNRSAPARSFSLLSFVRFWLQSALHSHPFTIVSLPPEDQHASVGHMVLLARATGRKSGWTTQLAEWVRIGSLAKQLSSSAATEASAEKGRLLTAPLPPTVEWTVIVDGPFGSIHTPAVLDHSYPTDRSTTAKNRVTTSSTDEQIRKNHLAKLHRRSPLARHDGVLFIAGGSGITYSLGLLLELVWARSKAEGLSVPSSGGKHTEGANGWPSKVCFIWTVREEAHVQWVEEQLRIVKELARTMGGGQEWLEIVVHVTGSEEGTTAPTTPLATLEVSTLAATTLDPSTGSSTLAPSASLTPASRYNADRDGVIGAASADVESGVESISSDKQSNSSVEPSPMPWLIRKGERIDALLLLADFLLKVVQPSPKAATSTSRAVSSTASLALVVCGPHQLAEDAMRAANRVQMDIVRGRGLSAGNAARRPGPTAVEASAADDGAPDGTLRLRELEVFKEDFGW